MTTIYQVMSGGALVAEYSSKERAITACEALSDSYDSYSQPYVMAMTKDGSHFSRQAVYPVRGELHSN